jgi:hypothetical protein
LTSPEIQLKLWRWGLGIGTGLSALAIFDLVRVLDHIGISILRSNWTLILLALILTFLAAAALFAATWHPAGKRLLESLSRPQVRAPLGRVIGWAAFLVVILAYTWVTMASPIRWQLLTNPPSGYYVAGWERNDYFFIDAASGLRTIGSVGSSIPNPWLHLWFFAMLAVLAAWIVKVVSPSIPFLRGLVLAALAQTLVYKLALYIPEVNAFPFSLGWSEASRYYYASLFASEKIYGQDVPLSMYHPTRYLLLSLPFLARNFSLAFHRFWQVFLWLALTGTSSFALARRLRLADRWIFMIFALWAYFFYMQGAVYYHLQVMVILILAGFSAEKPARTLVFVLLASLWAGISRVNWFPVPAMIAGLLYFIEKPVSGSLWLKYLARPAIWFVSGIGAALLAQGLYIRFSGNADIRGFGSSFTSDLLWYRLLPSPSYPAGVIPSVLWVAFPGLLALFWLLREQFRQVHPLRWLGIVGYILVLLAGGLVVSTKIGGGGDLHNMDAFLVVFLTFVAYALFGQIRPESGSWQVSLPPWPVIALGLLVPLTFVLFRAQTIEPLDFTSAQADLKGIRGVLSKARKEGEILFITQRHLLTFGNLNAKLVPEYELLTLMEMSISGNEPYLDQFHADLSSHRFAMIVADKQFTVIKTATDSFPEENNAWVRRVSIPLLCDYAPYITFDDLNVQIFLPRPERMCPQPVEGGSQ